MGGGRQLRHALFVGEGLSVLPPSFVSSQSPFSSIKGKPAAQRAGILQRPEMSNSAHS
jgi:hypothetical protein